jgi:hypothetical protein
VDAWVGEPLILRPTRAIAASGRRASPGRLRIWRRQCSRKPSSAPQKAATTRPAPTRCRVQNVCHGGGGGCGSERLSGDGCLSLHRHSLAQRRRQNDLGCRKTWCGCEESWHHDLTGFSLFLDALLSIRTKSGSQRLDHRGSCITTSTLLRSESCPVCPLTCVLSRASCHVRPVTCALSRARASPHLSCTVYSVARLLTAFCHCVRSDDACVPSPRLEPQGVTPGLA